MLDGTVGLYERTRRWSRGETGVISVGVQGSIPPGRISAILESYSLAQPGISFTYRDNAKKELFQALEQEEIDLAIMTLPLPGSMVATVPLWSDRVVAIMSAEHPIAQVGTASWAELHDGIFLIGKDDTGEELLALLMRKMRQAGFVPVTRQEAVRSLRVVALAAASLCCRMPGWVFCPLPSGSGSR
ncbi:MAG: LysR family substrate-binding domain-containing protein [Gluconobacter potus]|uniref:LysR family substrate-binding domain-containing protein n=1 Tax=Gluconobacter TaxID=441 RepID=UPI001E2C325A|nr:MULTISPECIES: LysR family substrate-binding domain-containing protein [unclassified Gluconobacter]